jgi:Cu/Ag efflux protein CusF
MNRYSFVLPLFIAATLSLPAAAQQPATPETPATPIEAGVMGDVITVTAKVEAVDLQNRTVQVVGPLGRKVTLKVDERVKNLPQVKVGDKVVVKYAESVALELTKGSSTLLKTETSTGPMAQAAGAKPGVSQVTRTTLDANVKKVDKKKSLVLLQGADGHFVEVQVKDPAVMKQIKVGDQVTATFTEAMVIDVVAPEHK